MKISKYHSKPIAFGIHHYIRVLFDDCIVAFYGGANRYTSVDALGAFRNFMAETNKKPLAVCAKIDRYVDVGSFSCPKFVNKPFNIFHGMISKDVSCLPVYEYHGFSSNTYTTYPCMLSQYLGTDERNAHVHTR